jgi:hypothetical protein
MWYEGTETRDLERLLDEDIGERMLLYDYDDNT